jgi:hypothetical protein
MSERGYARSDKNQKENIRGQTTARRTLDSCQADKAEAR